MGLRRKELKYHINAKLTAAEAMENLNSRLLYGSPSVAAWRRACEASLRASRRRRGKA